MKKIIFVFLFIYVLSIRCSYATTYKENITQKVYDFADLFTYEQEKKLQKKIDSFSTMSEIVFGDNKEADVIVVAIDKNPYGSPKLYVQSFCEQNSLKNDRIIFLIDNDNKNTYFSASGFFVKAWTNNDFVDISNVAYKSFLEEDYYKSALNIVNGLQEKVDAKIRKITLYSIVIAFIVGIIFMVVLNKNLHRKKSDKNVIYMDKQTIKIEILKN